MMDALDASPGNQNSNTSLRVSLELSINHMKNAKPEALKLFGFIGMFPGGISESELDEMWGNNSWVDLKDALVRASLLVYKRDDKGSLIYSMLPFMTIRAGEFLDDDPKLRHIYHMKCCRLFKNYLFSFYLSDKRMENIEKFIEMETNIWACIYRSLNRRRDIPYQELVEVARQQDNEPVNSLIVEDHHDISKHNTGWELEPKEDWMGDFTKEEVLTRSIKPASPGNSNEKCKINL
jgi:hypothetical protein